jgi:acyl-coenzyme A thioesterase PaaI-like protein
MTTMDRPASEPTGDVPAGYALEDWDSSFVNVIGRFFGRTGALADGTPAKWVSVRVDQRHANIWGYCHGAALTGFAEIATSASAYTPGGAPVVIVDLSMQFMAAPVLGDLLEIATWTTRRTRSLVFVQARAEVNGKVVFTASAIHKVVAA